MNRRKLGRAVRKCVASLTLLLGGSIGASVAAQGPAPAVRVDPLDGIVEAFKTHSVVMLPGGHGSKRFHDLLLKIVRDPRIQGTVTDIVVEFGTSRLQDVIDRYLRGDEIAQGVLRQAWQDTTVASATHDGPYVEEFYQSMRALNATLPKDKQFRVLGGDPPIDWHNVVSKQDLRKWTVRRDSFAADLIHSEVIARGRRALVVYGHLHFPRKEILTNYDMSNWQAQTMTSLLESRPGAKVFVIWAEGTPEVVKLQPDLAAWPPLSMALVAGTVLGAADFTVFNGDGDRFVIHGVDDFAKIPRDQHKPMLMEEQVDAILWNPNAPPAPLLLSPATCADPAYLPMRTGRIMLAGLPLAEIEAVKRACASR
jgi:hypothetical protein